MRRREFITVATTGVALGAAGVGLFSKNTKTPTSATISPVSGPKLAQHDLKEYLSKVRQFDGNHVGDTYMDETNFQILSNTMERLHRLQSLVGFGNFSLLDFDDAIKHAYHHTSVGNFTRSELNLLEMLFYEQASTYGFYGEKPLQNITDSIPKLEAVNVRNQGIFLFKGLPLETYNAIEKKVGDDVVLTSGIRSVTKQFLLFLDKTYKSNGNLSRASRSLAPPGYSFHGIGDFDVGQRGFGEKNFTDKFVTTNAFKRLEDLGYLTLRYPADNMLGVRFEPWHIKVSSRA
ncbi:MAG: D-alanyl-D-alanine carboxypeptidase family protein [Magnetococcales bacterium]|nr:D-alanyl-D-alanine carboxypeptidase family protein [Magnetococcales bacterium]